MPERHSRTLCRPTPTASRTSSPSSRPTCRQSRDDYCILVGVFIHWEAKNEKKIFDYNYRATKESIERALKNQPRVDAVISGAKTATHPFAGGADKS